MTTPAPGFEPLSERGVRMPVAAGDSSARLFAVAADSEFLDIFDLPFVSGDSNALRRPRSAIVTADTAERLFGGAGALGAGLLVANGVEVTITGVVDRIPEPSHLGRFGPAVAFDLIVSRDVYDELRGSADATPEDWSAADAVTYVLLPARTDPSPPPSSRRSSTRSWSGTCRRSSLPRRV